LNLFAILGAALAIGIFLPKLIEALTFFAASIVISSLFFKVKTNAVGDGVGVL
jgi:hypothetical protein